MPHSVDREPPGAKSPEGLTVGELASATGVAQGTIRSWENRYDFPRPSRRPSGHRRYSDHDVELIRRVQRARANGISLPKAISDVRSIASPRSIFAELRRAYPQLPLIRVKKRTLLALTKALEDEVCARAQRPLLIGAFQHERFLAQSRRRWEELARTARRTLVFAASGDESGSLANIEVIALAEDSPLRREWTVICDADDHAAVLTAWEVPAAQEQRDDERTFEAMWSLQPRVVREATRVALALSGSDLTTGDGDGLFSQVGEWSEELDRVSATVARAMSYLDTPQ